MDYDHVDGFQHFRRTCRLHLQALRFSEILLTIYKTTRRHNPEDHNPQQLNHNASTTVEYCPLSEVYY